MVLLSNFIRGQVEAAEMDFQNRLLLGVPMEEFGIDWDQLTDDPSDGSVGASFLTNPANPFIRNPHQLLIRFASEDRTADLLFKDVRPDRLVFKAGEVHRYLVDCQAFLRQLFVAIHVTCGSPARGEEIAGIRYRNTATRQRSVYIIHKLMILSGDYHKGSRIVGLDKHPVRSLPHRVGRLFVHYLALVRPLESLLTRIFGTTELAELMDDYVFVCYQRRWDGPILSNILRASCLCNLGVDMGIADWRQLVVAVMRRKLNVGSEVKCNSIADIQAGHTTEVAEAHYGVEERSLYHLDELTLQRSTSVRASNSPSPL